MLSCKETIPNIQYFWFQEMLSKLLSNQDDGEDREKQTEQSPGTNSQQPLISRKTPRGMYS